MDSLLQDIRYALRKLARAPGFTAIATLTLALAIGATTAIFSVVNGVLLKPLPFTEPERLVRVVSANREGRPSATSALDFIDYKAQSKTVPQMSPMDGASFNLTGDGEAERLDGAVVGANFFSILGTRPVIGRLFAEGDDQRNAERVVVLSDALWQRRFGGASSVLGKQIALNGRQYTVVGVAPRGFRYPDNPDIWVPQVWSEDDLNPENRGAHYLDGIGRLAPGATVAGAKSELQGIAKRLQEQYPRTNTNFGATVIALQENLVGDVRPALLALLGAVGFVLLIACANVANLLLVRAAARESEIAVRMSLGADRARVVRQLVTESAILSLLAGAVGALLAYGAVQTLVKFGPRSLPRLQEVHVDGIVLAFATLVAMATGLIFGLVPALHASRPNLASMLKEGSRGSSHGSGGRMRAALVVAEMALALVLLIGAGLLIRSFARLMSVDPGFHPEQVVTFNINPPDARYPTLAQQRQLVSDITRRMEELPGTRSAAVGFGLPLGGGVARTVIAIDGRPEDPLDQRKITEVVVVTPDYFRTMGIPLVKGRAFTADDRFGTQQVVVINKELAKRYFGDEDPIGKKVTLGIGLGDSTGAQVSAGGIVVGIVGDVRSRQLATTPDATTYMPYDQTPFGGLRVVLRTAAEPGAVATAARSALRQVDAELPLYGFRSYTEMVESSVSQPRFYMYLLGAFAAVALILAAVGLYGVIAYAVSQRTRELGIRMALGATPRMVIGLVVRQGVVLTVVGVVVGVMAAFWVTRAIGTMLYHVSAVDPLTFSAVAVGLFAVAVAACLVPALRASRIDPVNAIRTE